MRKRHSAEELPVLIMTSHVADCLNLVGKLKQLGANEFIAKPFQTKGWTLSRAVSKLLKERAKAQRARQTALPQRFAGGELHLGAERVTLCGATVLVKSRSPLMCAVLEELSDRNSFGEYVSLSGPELAERLNNQRGSNAISSAVSKFRARVVAELAERYEFTVGSDDVIQSRGAGYRLNKWIRVSYADGDPRQTLTGGQPSSQATTSLTLVDTQGTSNSPMAAGTNAVVRTEPLVSDANQAQRRQWIISQLRLKRKLRAPDIARELECSVQTIRLDIEALRKAGRIEFVGAAKSGYYRLVR
jgi:DNA-binding response OmpR family regulator/biotin operon repressor